MSRFLFENLTRLAEFLSVEANWLVHGETSTGTVRFREPSVSFKVTTNLASEPMITDQSVREKILDNPDGISTITLLDVWLVASRRTPTSKIGLQTAC